MAAHPRVFQERRLANPSQMPVPPRMAEKVIAAALIAISSFLAHEIDRMTNVQNAHGSASRRGTVPRLATMSSATTTQRSPANARARRDNASELMSVYVETI